MDIDEITEWWYVSNLFPRMSLLIWEEACWPGSCGYSPQVMVARGSLFMMTGLSSGADFVNIYEYLQYGMCILLFSIQYDYDANLR